MCGKGLKSIDFILFSNFRKKESESSSGPVNFYFAKWIWCWIFNVSGPGYQRLWCAPMQLIKHWSRELKMQASRSIQSSITLEQFSKNKTNNNTEWRDKQTPWIGTTIKGIITKYFISGLISSKIFEIFNSKSKIQLITPTVAEAKRNQNHQRRAMKR